MSLVRKTEMVTAKKNNSSICKYFDASIYSHSLLRRAAKAFSGLALIKIRREGKYREVTFDSVQKDDKAVIADEFANYALSCLMVKE